MAVDANGVEIPEVIAEVPPVLPTIPEVVAPVVIPAVIPKPEPTGNDYFDTVLNIIHEKGIQPDKYKQEFIAEGAISAESRATLVTALGESQVKLIERGLADEVGKIKTTQETEATRIFASVGLPGVADGKAAFAMLAAWSQENVSAEERTTLNEMLGKGGVQADLAVKALKDKYMADPTYTVPAALVTGDGITNSAGVELISRSTYVVELRKAENARDRVAVAKLHARAKHTMATNKEAWRP